MTAYNDPVSQQFRRDLAVMTKDSQLLQSMTEAFTEPLRLQPHALTIDQQLQNQIEHQNQQNSPEASAPPTVHMSWYHQQELKASRKKVMPLFIDYVQQYTNSQQLQQMHISGSGSNSCSDGSGSN